MAKLDKQPKSAKEEKWIEERVAEATNLVPEAAHSVSLIPTPNDFTLDTFQMYLICQQQSFTAQIPLAATAVPVLFSAGELSYSDPFLYGNRVSDVYLFYANSVFSPTLTRDVHVIVTNQCNSGFVTQEFIDLCIANIPDLKTIQLWKSDGTIDFYLYDANSLVVNP